MGKGLGDGEAAEKGRLFIELYFISWCDFLCSARTISSLRTVAILEFTHPNSSSVWYSFLPLNMFLNQKWCLPLWDLEPSGHISKGAEMVLWGKCTHRPLGGRRGDHIKYRMLKKKKNTGCSRLPWWSGGSDSALPMRGARFRFLVRELDPTCFH